MTKSRSYNYGFPDSSQSAQLILPHLFEVAGTFDSALDVGGGVGAWSAVLKRHGVSKLVCVDDPKIDISQLLVEPSEFLGCDLSCNFPPPVRSDLVLCLEVAEHLPKSQSDRLIQFLTASGDVVLFSAAIPGQPSPSHINEQPAEFWRQLFERFGFRRFDCIRPRIASDERIPYWYRQNTYVFASEATAQRRQLTSSSFSEIPREFELVHSRVLQRYRQIRHPHMKDVPAIVRRSLMTRLRRFL